MNLIILAFGLVQANPQDYEYQEDLRHKFMAWEKTHLDPYIIEDYLHDQYGIVSPM